MHITIINVDNIHLKADFVSPKLTKLDFALASYVEAKAERARFELAVPCGTKVFKTFALDHYATPPTFAFVSRLTAMQTNPHFGGLSPPWRVV